MNTHSPPPSIEEAVAFSIKNTAHSYLIYGQSEIAIQLLRGLHTLLPEDVETALLLAWAELHHGSSQIAEDILRLPIPNISSHPAFAALESLLALQQGSANAVEKFDALANFFQDNQVYQK